MCGGGEGGWGSVCGGRVSVGVGKRRGVSVWGEGECGGG